MSFVALIGHFSCLRISWESGCRIGAPFSRRTPSPSRHHFLSLRACERTVLSDTHKGIHRSQDLVCTPIIIVDTNTVSPFCSTTARRLIVSVAFSLIPLTDKLRNFLKVSEIAGFRGASRLYTMNDVEFSCSHQKGHSFKFSIPTKFT